MKSILARLSSRQFFWLLVGITLLGAIPRFYGVFSKPLWEDETALWMEALGWNAYTADGFFTTFTSYFVMWLFQDTSPALLHLLPAFFGSLAVLAVGLLGCSLQSRMTGLIAALLLAFAPAAIYFSREARPYGALLAFTAFLYLFFFKVIDDRKSHVRTAIKDWAGLWLFTLLATSCHYSALILVATMGIAGAILYSSRRQWVKIAVLAGVLISASLPTLLYKCNQHSPGAIDGISTLPVTDFLMLFLRSVGPEFQKLEPIQWIYSAVLAALLWTGSWSLLRERKFPVLVFWASILSTLVVLYFCFGGRAAWGYAVARYFSHLLVPIACLAAAAFVAISDRLKIRSEYLFLPLTAFLLWCWTGSVSSLSKVCPGTTMANYIETNSGVRGVLFHTERMLASFQSKPADLPLYVVKWKNPELLKTKPLLSRGSLRTWQVPSEPAGVLPSGKYLRYGSGPQHPQIDSCEWVGDAIQECIVVEPLIPSSLSGSTSPASSGLQEG